MWLLNSKEKLDNRDPQRARMFELTDSMMSVNLKEKIDIMSEEKNFRRNKDTLKTIGRSPTVAKHNIWNFLKNSLDVINSRINEYKGRKNW